MPQKPDQITWKKCPWFPLFQEHDPPWLFPPGTRWGQAAETGFPDPGHRAGNNSGDSRDPAAGMGRNNPPPSRHPGACCFPVVLILAHPHPGFGRLPQGLREPSAPRCRVVRRDPDRKGQNCRYYPVLQTIPA